MEPYDVIVNQPVVIDNVSSKLPEMKVLHSNIQPHTSTISDSEWEKLKWKNSC